MKLRQRTAHRCAVRFRVGPQISLELLGPTQHSPVLPSSHTSLQTPLNTSSIVFARDMRDLLLPNLSPPYHTRQYRHAELPIRPTILGLFVSLPTYCSLVA